LMMILLPFLLGPAAALALIADIRIRWTDPASRSKWLWLCLLFWPVGLYYYFAYGFQSLPARVLPPPLPPGVSSAGPFAGFPPPAVTPKSKAAGRSLIWGGVSMVSPVFPLALPASLVGIVYGHKGLLEVKRSKGLFKNRG
jgi:hypothetical protein